MKSVLGFLAFIVLYVGAEVIGEALPWWVGLAMVLGFVSFLIAILVKIGRSY